MKGKRRQRLVWRSYQGLKIPHEILMKYYARYSDEYPTKRSREFSHENTLLGMEIQLLRLDKDWTVEKFAKHVDVPVIVIEDLEMGHSGLHIRAYIEIVRKLKVKLKDLFENLEDLPLPP